MKPVIGDDAKYSNEIVFQTQYSLKLKKLKLKLKCFVEITDSEDTGVCS